MARRNRARPNPTAPSLGGAVGWARTESAADGLWTVRTVPGARGLKAYRCPGCDHEIAPGTGHVVAWPVRADGVDDSDQRRHWHSPCWAARDRRRPGTPRYR